MSSVSRFGYLKALILLFICGCASTSSAPCVPAAHRGYHAQAVDNSRESIIAALEAKVPYIELDVRRTSYDELILFHDKTITKLNFEGASELLGTSPEGMTPEQRKRSRSCRNGKCAPILELHEAIKVAVSGTSLLLVDLKSEIPDTIDRVILTALAIDAPEKLVMQCQSMESLKYIRSKYPEIRTLARIHEIGELSSAIELRPYIVQLDRENVTADNLKLIEKAGAKLLVKSLDELGDDAETWSALEKIGVDIILTDYPVGVSEFCNNNG